MISQILKAAAVAVPAVILLFSAIGIFKKSRNQTKSQTKAQFKKIKVFRFAALLFALVCCFVFTLGSYFDTEKQASAVISLNYSEASLGQNANGTRYNMSEIICDDVIERMAEKGGIDDVSVSDLKSCFAVSPLTQGNSYSEDSYHISTEFEVVYNANKKTQKYDSETLVQLLCNSYRDYYFDKYVNDFQIQLETLADETRNLDYIDATDLLGKKANKILNYLYGLQQKNSSFISDSGATFASVAAKVDTLNAVQINDMLYSYILQNGISGDVDRLLNRFTYINKQSDFEKQKLSQSYDITNSAIAKYDKDMARIVLVPTWDNDGQYYMGRTKIGIDTLSVQSVAYSKNLANVEKGIKDNELKIAKFSEAAGNSEQNRSYVKDLISSTEQSLEKLAEEARLIGQEYYTNQMNQCISAVVYPATVLSKAKNLLAVFAFAYIAFAAKKFCNEFGEKAEKQNRA